METFSNVVGIAGDWHGNQSWALSMLEIFKKSRVSEIFHLGDFGIWNDKSGVEFMARVTAALKKNGQHLYVTPGNHEDWLYLVDLPQVNGLFILSEAISVFPRGYRGLLGSSSFVSLGGGASIDFETRKKYVTWFPEEMLTMGDVFKVSCEGKADIMFAHDAPLGIPFLEKLKASTAHWWSDAGLAYAHQGQEMMTDAFLAVQPHVFFHGHFHCFYSGTVAFQGVSQEAAESTSFKTLCISLDCDGQEKNIGIFDAEKRELTLLN